MNNYVNKLDYLGEIDKFPEIYNLPRLINHEKIKKSRLIDDQIDGSINQNLPTMKILGSFIREFYQTFLKELT